MFKSNPHIKTLKKDLQSHFEAIATGIIAKKTVERQHTAANEAAFKDDENAKQLAALILAYQKLAFENEERKKVVAGLIIANRALKKEVAEKSALKKVTEKAVKSERDQFYDLFQQAPSCIGVLKGPNHVFEMGNTLYLQLIGKQDIIGKTVNEVLPEVVEQGFIKILDGVYETGNPFSVNEMLVKLDYEGNGKLTDVYLNIVYQAYRSNKGIIEGVFFFTVDVTEQVVSRKKIEESEKRYKELIMELPVATYSCDTEGRITLFNKAAVKLWGQEPEIGNDFWCGSSKIFSVDGNFLPFDLCSMALALKEGRTIIGEEIIIESVQGVHRNVVPHQVPVFDSAGRLTGAINVLIDITDNKATQQALEQSEKRYRQIVETAEEGIWMIDKNNCTTFVNRKLCQILGYTSAEMMGKKNTFFMDKEGKEIAAEASRTRISGRNEKMDISLLHKNGKKVWVTLTGSTILNKKGQYQSGLAMVTDITERKAFEEKLASNEARLIEAEAIAHLGNWEINLAEDSHYWSDEVYKILGISKEDVTPSSEAFMSFVHPDDLDEANEKIAHGFKTCENISVDFRFIRPDGAIRYGYTQWKFKIGKTVDPEWLLGIFQDITERKLAETERTKMVNDLIQRNENLEQFTYIVSHNLRAPVANIIGAANMMNNAGLSTTKKDLLSKGLNQSVTRLDNVVRDLSYILQVKGEIDAIREKVHFSELVNTIELSINNLIIQDSIKIEYDFSEIDEFITLKSYLYSIFYNLISNSIKYRQQNIQSIIKITSHRKDDHIELIFTDNGMGIDLKTRKNQVFGLYKRFHTNIEGKGMGLFIVKSQVETLGGRISLKSEVNKGTEFKIEFEV